MLTVALIFFALAAVIGIILAVTHIKKKTVPITYALPHGIVAATGLVLLLLSYAQGTAAVGLPLLLFVIAALGGFVLFTAHLRARPVPVPLIVVHAVVAVSAFGLLVYQGVLK